MSVLDAYCLVSWSSHKQPQKKNLSQDTVKQVSRRSRTKPGGSARQLDVSRCLCRLYRPSRSPRKPKRAADEIRFEWDETKKYTQSSLITNSNVKMEPLRFILTPKSRYLGAFFVFMCFVKNCSCVCLNPSLSIRKEVTPIKADV